MTLLGSTCCTEESTPELLLVNDVVRRCFAFLDIDGKLTEGWTDFAPKGGKLISIMGFNRFESGNMALGADHGTPFL